jgi:hypothetical protein
MASYTEEILRAAREASGPSIRDLESIQCFQTRPTTKDAVRIFFYSFNNSFSNVYCSFFLEWDAHLLGSPSYRGVFVHPR